MSALARPRTVIHPDLPKPPDHRILDGDPPVVTIRPNKKKPRFYISSGEFNVYEMEGDDVSLDDVIACLLENYVIEEPWSSDAAVWHRQKLMALVTALPFDGRRLVFRFDGPKVTRDVYPASREFLAEADRKLGRAPR